jgi:hypothetical protein
MGKLEFAWFVSKSINILFLTLLEELVLVWVFTFPPNPCSNHRNLGGFCQYTRYISIQNLPEISDILATGGFGVRSTPGGGSVRSTFLTLLALGRNITAQKKSKLQ